MHCSARSLVGESVQNPALYYRNNVIGTFNLIEAMRKYGVKSFVFSSSVAIYGNPLQDKINEDHPKQPINPYGKSKLMVDQMLDDYFKACGMNSVSLRYFNAAGADTAVELGEDHNPETHLIPNILKAAKGVNSATIKVFGDDYIHVEDLCNAHLKAINYIWNKNLPLIHSI